MSDTRPVYLVAPIRCVREEARDTRTIELGLSLPSEPGQFVMVWVPRLDEKPFCVAGDDPLTLTIRRVGPLTEALFGLGQGDRLWIRGPLGRGFSVAGRRILAVGGGYGAAPLGFLCRRASRAGVEVVLASGARTAPDLLVPASARTWASEIHTATEDGSAGFHGRVTELAARLLRQGRFDGIYSCGPNAMLDAVARLAREAGIAAELSFERYMRCGIGVCGSCEHGGSLVCSDGPVFRYAPDGSRVGAHGADRPELRLPQTPCLDRKRSED
jgi:dihydroorotate dehydrogenase electron transfer subunit